MPTLMRWFNSAEDMLLWGGPGLIYGLNEQGFADQIKLHLVNSRALLNTAGDVVGFGQYYDRVGRIHFGRIGIATEQRGKGLSHILMAMLIKEATLNDTRELSLFVMQGNMPAIRCYERLGFRCTSYPDAMPQGMVDVEYWINDGNKD